MQPGQDGYHCRLVQTVSADIARNAVAIFDDWQARYRDVLQNLGPDAIYRSDAEVLQELLRALMTRLQVTSESRLDRPLGTFDRPRPARAEARRSGRSARHVLLSLAALRDLASHLAALDPPLTAHLDGQFQQAMTRLEALDDPVFAAVAQPSGRLRLEVIQQAIQIIHSTVETDLGPKLGVAVGFNSLDGD